jgi:hypothetical protein
MDAELRAALPEHVCGKRFHPRALRIIRETVTEYQHTSRQEIARQVCERLGWYDRCGRRKAMCGATTLLRFHRKGWIELPPPRTPRQAPARHRALPEGFAIPETMLDVALAELGKVRLETVSTLADSRLWNGLISHYHYQGYAPACGAQLRYLAHSEQGVLGAVGFSGAARQLRDRDRWIGWDPQQRRVNRHLIVNHSRFLILPWVRVANLASHLLSLASRRLPGDFQRRYGYAPVLLESFVEQERFDGTCYKAANWLCVGRTSGRGRTDLRPWKQRREEAPPLPIKSIWLYPLTPKARRRLCTPATEVTP